MEVRMSLWFSEYIERLSDNDYNKIDKFIEHVEKYGLTGLMGSNLKSDRVNSKNPNAKNDELFAQQNNLWHYHIGIPKYDTTKGIGQYKSAFYLHYERYPDYIRIIGMDDHNPFTLPSKKMFEQIKKSIESGTAGAIPPEIINGSFEDFNKWMLTDTRIK